MFEKIHRLEVLPKRIVQILNFFDAFGYNSGSSKISNSRRVTYLILFVHILTAMIFTFVKFKILIEQYKAHGFVPAINEGLQYSATLYTYWIIVLESLMYRQSHLKFWGILQQIDKHFHRQTDKHFYSFIIKLAEFFLITILIQADSIIRFGIKLSLIAYIILFRMCHARVFYYIFCLEIIQWQLENIEKVIKKMQFSLNNPDFGNRFKWIREYFHLVHKMTLLLNKMCGWSILATTMSCFYYIIATLNWFYIGFKYSNPTNIFGNLLFESREKELISFAFI